MAATTLFTATAAVAAPIATSAPQFCTYDTDTHGYACSASQEQAVLRMSNGTTTDEKALAQASGKIIQGKFFTDRNFGGSTFTVYGTGLCNPADGKINYNFNFPAGWRNVISSTEAYGNCKIWLYPELDLKGRRDGPFLDNTGFVGDYMNNRTKSVGFS